MIVNSQKITHLYKFTNMTIIYLFTMFGTDRSVFFSFSNNDKAGVFITDGVAEVFFFIHCLKLNKFPKGTC